MHLRICRESSLSRVSFKVVNEIVLVEVDRRTGSVKCKVKNGGWEEASRECEVYCTVEWKMENEKKPVGSGECEVYDVEWKMENCSTVEYCSVWSSTTYSTVQSTKNSVCVQWEQYYSLVARERDDYHCTVHHALYVLFSGAVVCAHRTFFGTLLLSTTIEESTVLYSHRVWLKNLFSFFLYVVWYYNY
jgi:hypothetical protein